MSSVTDRWMRLLSQLSKGALKREIDDELSYHLEMRARDFEAQGMDPESARREAERRFGDLERIRREAYRVERARVRRQFRALQLGEIGQDLRYGVRQLQRRPGFSAVVVLILALGIGASTAVFSVVKGVFLQPLPYESPDRLVMIWEADRLTDEAPVSDPNFLDWREQNHSFEHIAAFSHRFANLAGGGEPERVLRGMGTAGFFEILRVQLAAGRAFASDEELEGNNRVAVISHDLWMRRFDGDPSVLGAVIVLDGEPHALIGILPAGFEQPSPWFYGHRIDVWTPLALQADRGWHRLLVLGRLKDGTSLEAAREDMRNITAQLAEAYPETNEDVSAAVFTLHEQLLGDVGERLFILLAVAGLVLLVACGNVAGLLTARGITRRTEVAVRSALGAGRARLIRQLLMENLPLSLLGGLLGLFAAIWGVGLLRAGLPSGLPRTENITIDGGVLAFTLSVSLLAGLVFGFTPALAFSRANLNESLKEAGRSSATGRGGHRLRNLLVVAQFAVTLVLVNFAALMVNSYVRLRNEDQGFDPSNVLTMGVSLQGPSFAEPAQVRAFYDETLERIAALPGVRYAGATSKLPFSGGTNIRFVIEGHEAETSAGQGPLVEISIVTPGYFQAMGIPLLAGRNLTAQDTNPAHPGVIINQRMAESVWPGESPISRRFGYPPHWATVVGVVGDVRQWGVEHPAIPEAYLPYSPSPPSPLTSFNRVRFLIVRSEIDPLSLAGAIRQEVLSVSRDQPVSQINTMDQILSARMGGRRFNALLTGLFAAMALVLVAAGIYSVMAFFVAQRTHDIGVRVALGAAQGSVVRLVLLRGLKLAVIGVAIGLVGVYVSTRVTERMLYGVRPIDVPTIVGGVAFMIAVALLGSAIPAMRATRVDPIAALRTE